MMAEDRSGTSDPLPALMRWYAAQCDGTWEQRNGVCIDTLDNPGWTVRIDTTGTRLPLGDRPKQEIDMDSETDWMVHWVEEGVFHGAGGPHRLADLLALFLRKVTQ